MLEIRVTTEGSGQHGYVPPNDAIGESVQGWLAASLRNGSVVVVDGQPRPTFDGPMHFNVSIECRRDPVGPNHVGVEAFRMLNSHTVELRVRPKTSQWRWTCFVVCPSMEVALTVFARNRPEAVMYVAALNEEIERQQQAERAASPQPRRQSRRTPKRRKPRQEELVRAEIQDEAARAHFSYLVQQQLNQADDTEFTAEDVIGLGLVAIQRDNVSTSAALTLLMTLIDDGFFNPIARPDVQYFAPTSLVAEYAARHQQRLQEEIRDRLQGDLAHHNRQFDASLEEERRLERAILAEHQKREGLQATIDALEAQLAALPPPNGE